MFVVDMTPHDNYGRSLVLVNEYGDSTEITIPSFLRRAVVSFDVSWLM